MKQTLILLLSAILLNGCQKEKITLSADAHDVFYLENHGSAMPIRVHGNTASKTFIMMIHGGPGGDAIVYRSEYVKATVESEFAMVYWDQRNSGASQGNRNGQYNDIAYFIEDFEKVITLLKHRYGSDISLFVNGHSWGGFLTPSFLQKGNNQQLVKGWIQSAGAHNIPLLNQYAVQMLLDKASIEISAGRNIGKWTEIKEYCEGITFPLSTEVGRQINLYSAEAQTLTPEIPKDSPSIQEVYQTYTENHFPLVRLFFPYNPVTGSLADWLFQGQEVSTGMSKITIPTLLLFAKWDFVCPAPLADDIEQRIQSSFVRKRVLENSGHGLMAGADKEVYWEEVLDFVRRFR